MERKLTIISQPENYTNQLSRKILEDNRDKLDAMADALMKYETIDVHQIDDIMEGKSPRPPKGWSGNGGSGSGPAGGEKSEEESPANEKPPEDSADEAVKFKIMNLLLELLRGKNFLNIAFMAQTGTK